MCDPQQARLVWMKVQALLADRFGNTDCTGPTSSCVPNTCSKSLALRTGGARPASRGCTSGCNRWSTSLRAGARSPVSGQFLHPASQGMRTRDASSSRRLIQLEFGERIVQVRPTLHVGLCQFILEQARVQPRAQYSFVQLLADED